MWQPWLPRVQPQHSQVELSEAAGSGGHLRLETEVSRCLGVSSIQRCFLICVYTVYCVIIINSNKNDDDNSNNDSNPNGSNARKEHEQIDIANI